MVDDIDTSHLLHGATDSEGTSTEGSEGTTADSGSLSGVRR